MSNDAANGTPEPEAERAAGSLHSVGARLRAARDTRELSVEAIALQLRLAPRVVEALEAGDEQHLPGLAFTRGYVRAYARLVGLDAEALLAELGTAAPSDSVTLSPVGSIHVRRRAPLGRWLLWTALLLLLLALLFYGIPVADRLLSPERSPPAVELAPAPLPAPGADTPAPAAPGPDASPQTGVQPLRLPPPASDEAPPVPAETAPAPADVAAPPPAPPLAQAVLQLHFKEDSWVEVEANGRRLLIGIGRAGDTRRLRGSPPFQVLLGNAPAVDIQYNGARFDAAPFTHGRVARFRLDR